MLQVLIRQCIEEYMRRHEAQAGGPAELRDIGRRLVRRIQAGYKDVMHSHRVWLSAARCLLSITMYGVHVSRLLLAAEMLSVMCTI